VLVLVEQAPPVTVVVSHTGLVVDVEARLSQTVPAATQTGLYDVLYRVMQQPVLQVLPAQQGALSVPHAWHRLLLQIIPGSVQVLFAQHGPPAAPQVAQMFEDVLHAAFASLHPLGFAVVAVQQASPRAPQVLHA
jgi:hypothetical protein